MQEREFFESELDTVQSQKIIQRGVFANIFLDIFNLKHFHFRPVHGKHQYYST